jgi:hypothetical protein
MKKYPFSFVLLVSLGHIITGCSSRQPEGSSTRGSGQLDQSVVASPEASLTPLPKDAAKFKGEFHLPDDEAFRIILREVPQQSGLLTNTVLYHRNDPLTLRFFYDADRDVLSNRLQQNAPSYSLMRLNAAGDLLTEISFDERRNQTDTTVYVRTQKTR